MKPKKIVTGRPATASVSRLVIADSEEIRITDIPPMPVLYPVNDLGAAQTGLYSRRPVVSSDDDVKPCQASTSNATVRPALDYDHLYVSAGVSVDRFLTAPLQFLIDELEF